MNDAGRPQTEKELELDGVIAEYRRRVANGEDVDRDKLIAKFPHLADELRAFFESGVLTASLADADAQLSGLETLPPNPLADSVSEQPKAANTPTPERLGKYEIVKVLGRGAMGVVYLAKDSQLGRLVALKIPTLAAGESEKSLRRFSREGKAAAILSHSNICTVHEVDQVGSTHYIAMQYIDGKPLSTYISPNRPMDERSAMVIVRKLAQALSHAHQRGVVHRDLKPANVMMNRSREPILTDFGLARKLNSVESVRLTQTGALLGTPAYMSPEQIEGKLNTVGPASDIYSLGVIFYELLTGRLPFQGPIAAILAQIVAKDPEKPSALRPNLDRRLELICLRMMSKPIGKRFASMDEVVDALSCVLKTPAERDEEDANAATRKMRSESPKVMALTTGDAQAIYRTARKCHASHDYEQAVDMLQQIPERFRDPQIEALLEEATERHDEFSYLLAAIEDAEIRQDYHGLLPTVERLLELKPGHRQAFAIYKQLTAGGQSRSGPRLKRKQTSAFPKNVKWTVGGGTAILVAVVMFAVMRHSVTPNGEQNAVSRTATADAANSDRLSPGNEVDGKNLKREWTEKANAVPEKNSAGSPPTLLMAPFNEEAAQKAQSAWAASLKTPEEITNSIGMKLKLIPPGEFSMGAPDSKEASQPDEKPQHRVQITKPFYLGVHEVTVGQFRQFTSGSGYKTEAEKDGKGAFGFDKKAKRWKQNPNYNWRNPGFQQTDDHPVVDVSWNDAAAFCEWLSKQAGKTYRLPTEAEWEYGCRAGTITRYSFGDNQADLSDYAWHDKNAYAVGEYTHSVGLKKPNAFDLFDMYGNVWERCSDWYGENYYANSPKTDPQGPSASSLRVLRGGGWFVNPDVRSSDRYSYTPADRFNDVGFRVVCELAAGTGQLTRKEVSAATAPALLIAPFDKAAARKTQSAWAASLQTPEEMTNSIGMMLRLIPSGEFLMGSPDTDKDASADEKPQHRVQITRPFYLGVHEVTVGQFRQFTSASGYRTEAEKDGKGGFAFDKRANTWKQSTKYNWRNPSFQQTDDHPVVDVSWNDAEAFCEWLSKQEGKTYRLPTEAEWEYACRAGTETRYSFGDDESDLGAYAWYDKNASAVGEYTHPVGLKKPNDFGLFDLHGNVWEWCSDWHADGYFKNSLVENPEGPSTAANRVLRGGGWLLDAAYCRSGNRDGDRPRNRYGYFGFRVVCEFANAVRDESTLKGTSASDPPSEPWLREDWKIRVNGDGATPDDKNTGHGWFEGDITETYVNRPHFEGKGKHSGVLILHPISKNEPAKISYKKIVAVDKPILVVTACGNVIGDHVLRCVANGETVKEYTLDGKTWTTCEFDLSQLAGKPAELELWNVCGGSKDWHFEHCFIDRIEFRSK